MGKLAFGERSLFLECSEWLTYECYCLQSLTPEMGPFFGWFWSSASHTHTVRDCRWSELGTVQFSWNPQCWACCNGGLPKAPCAFHCQRWARAEPRVVTAQTPRETRGSFLSFSACSLHIFFSRLQHSNLRGMLPGVLAAWLFLTSGSSWLGMHCMNFTKLCLFFKSHINKWISSQKAGEYLGGSVSPSSWFPLRLSCTHSQRCDRLGAGASMRPWKAQTAYVLCFAGRAVSVIIIQFCRRSHKH